MTTTSPALHAMALTHISLSWKLQRELSQSGKERGEYTIGEIGKNRGNQVRAIDRVRDLNLQGAMNGMREVVTIAQVDVAEESATSTRYSVKAWLCCGRVARVTQRPNGELQRARLHIFMLSGDVLISTTG